MDARKPGSIIAVGGAKVLVGLAVPKDDVWLDETLLVAELVGRIVELDDGSDTEFRHDVASPATIVYSWSEKMRVL